MKPGPCNSEFRRNACASGHSTACCRHGAGLGRVETTVAGFLGEPFVAKAARAGRSSESICVCWEGFGDRFGAAVVPTRPAPRRKEGG
eukprot:3093399-Pyramimonas_sp.AAC.1